MASLSPEFQIATTLDEIGCVPSNFTEIAGRHSNSRVLAALKGSNNFDLDDGEFYLGLARQMKRLAAEYPVPIDWRKTQAIREILAARKENPRPVPFAVVLIGPQLFKKIVSGRVETTTSYQDCAAFENLLVANAALRILDEMGVRELRTTTITNQRRAPETMLATLSEFGFTQVVQ